jgi:hypothetical protein
VRDLDAYPLGSALVGAAQYLRMWTDYQNEPIDMALSAGWTPLARAAAWPDGS